MVFRQCMAVPIVKAGKKNTYSLDEQALFDIIGSEDVAHKKVAVVAVAGAFRKGKSFMLNFFIHYLEQLEANNVNKEEWFSEDTVLDKFQWRGGRERDTYGIMMWNKPFILRDHDGSETVVLLMDTQGTFDSKSTLNECATIFALSTMLTSLQIFNVSQDIQEDNLQHLQLFTQFAKLAKNSGDKAPFQSLMFLVRDWQNSKECCFGREGGKVHLEEILEISDDQPEELRQLRKDLNSSFTDLSCYLMPHPGLRIANNNEEKKLGKVEEEFKAHLMQFVPSIFADIRPKLINGQEIECVDLLQYFKSYMSVFNGNTLPTPKTVFAAAVEGSICSALEKAKAVYNEATSEVSQRSFVEFDMAHKNGKAAAISAFTSAPTLGGNESKEDYLPELNKHIEERYSQLGKVIKCREQLQRQKQEIEDKLKEALEKGEETAKELERQKQVIEKQLEESNKTVKAANNKTLGGIVKKIGMIPVDAVGTAVAALGDLVDIATGSGLGNISPYSRATLGKAFW